MAAEPWTTETDRAALLALAREYEDEIASKKQHRERRAIARAALLSGPS